MFETRGKLTSTDVKLFGLLYTLARSCCRISDGSLRMIFVPVLRFLLLTNILYCYAEIMAGLSAVCYDALLDG